MEFKELEIKKEGSWLTRTLKDPHIRKTLIYIAIGAIAGLVIFYFTEGKEMDNMVFGDIFKSMLIGGFFGFFITNSPCARNKC
jgi:RsiW-degrading membrane proteinase PrsW (M82 family)